MEPSRWRSRLSRQQKQTKSTDADAAFVAEDEDDAAFVNLLKKLEPLNGSDCEGDLESMCSSEDSDSGSDGAEDDADSDKAELEEVAEVFRKAPGTFTIYSNGYFSFTDNPAYPDIKVLIVPRWRKAGLLGTEAMSKTLVPTHYGDTRENPVRTTLLLKSWMLNRATRHGFCNAKASRRRLFAREAAELRAAVVGMSSVAAPTTGNTYADDIIREWTPHVLLAG